QNQNWFATSVGQHFHLLPADTNDAGTKRLARGLLGCETSRKFIHPGAIPFTLTFGVTALQETITEVVERSLDPGDFNNICAYSKLAFTLRIKNRNIPAIAFTLLKIGRRICSPT